MEPKRERKKSTARERCEQTMKVGKASQYIECIDSLHRGDKVVLWLRVSISSNESHLLQQETDLRQACEERGIEIVTIRSHVTRAYAIDAEYSPDREFWGRVLFDAAFSARDNGATLLATEVDRFVRNHLWSRHTPQAPTESDFETLRDWTLGVRLATLTHPDTTLEQAHGKKVKRGHRTTKKSIGRPKNLSFKERRRQSIERAQELHCQGLTVREIATENGK